MDLLGLGQKLRPDAERLKINVDRRMEIILHAYNLYCDELFKREGPGGLSADVDLIGEGILVNCGRIKKEAKYFRCVLVVIFNKYCNFDLKEAEAIGDNGYFKYEHLLKEHLPMNANDSEYECLTEEAENLGVDRSRAESIIWVARESLSRFFQYGDHKDVERIGIHIDKIAMPFTDTCKTPAECRFFCKAIEYLIYEDHGRERQFAEDLSNFVAQRAAQLFEVKKSTSGKGCLVLFGIVGVLPIGVITARYFFA